MDTAAPEPIAVAPIEVLVVDDEPLFVEMVCTLLAQDDRIEVVGRACDGREAVELVTRLDPDVTLMDISMPGVDGIEAVHQIRRRLPEACVVILTGSYIPAEVDRSRQAGAAAFLTKDRVGAELLGAILEVAGR